VVWKSDAFAAQNILHQEAWQFSNLTQYFCRSNAWIKLTEHCFKRTEAGSLPKMSFINAIINDSYLIFAFRVRVEFLDLYISCCVGCVCFRVGHFVCHAITVVTVDFVPPHQPIPKKLVVTVPQKPRNKNTMVLLSD